LHTLEHRAIPAHLVVTSSANERPVHGEQAPMRGLFHLYKTFQDSLPVCTFCQSRAPRGEQQPRERERESEWEREGVEREPLWKQGGCQFLIPIPHFQKVVGEHLSFTCFNCRCPASLRLDVNVSVSSIPFVPEASPFQRGWKTHTWKSRKTFCLTSASLKKSAFRPSSSRKTWIDMASTVREMDGWMEGWMEGGRGAWSIGRCKEREVVNWVIKESQDEGAHMYLWI